MRAQFIIIILIVSSLILSGCGKFTHPTQFKLDSKQEIPDTVRKAGFKLAFEMLGLESPFFLIKYDLMEDNLFKISLFNLRIEKAALKLSSNTPKVIAIIKNDGEIISKQEIYKQESLPPEEGGGGGGTSGSGGSVPNTDVVYAEFFEDAYYQMRFGGTPLRIYFNPSTFYSGQYVDIYISDLALIDIQGRSSPATWNDIISSFRAFNQYGIYFRGLVVHKDAYFSGGSHTFTLNYDDNFDDEYFGFPSFQKINDRVSSFVISFAK
jgi:hypothetical protein